MGYVGVLDAGEGRGLVGILYTLRKWSLCIADVLIKITFQSVGYENTDSMGMDLA
jgi:hypothetical protein